MYNKGTKLVCIKSDGRLEDDIMFKEEFSLIVGKTYQYKTRTIGDDIIGISESNSCVGFFPHGVMEKYFVTLAESRDNRLNEILE